MGKGGVPDRWNNYTPIGKALENVRIVAFKVPLRDGGGWSVQESDRLDIDKLCEQIPNLGLVIDLTNTYKYYDIGRLQEKGVEHKKILVPGHVLPPLSLRRKFQNCVRAYLEKNSDNDKLIGVHCTHGVNRTGLMICHYLVAELKMQPDEAIACFEAARGHKIERENYREYIHSLGKDSANKEEECDNQPEEDQGVKRPRENRRDRNEEAECSEPNRSRFCGRRDDQYVARHQPERFEQPARQQRFRNDQSHWRNQDSAQNHQRWQPQHQRTDTGRVNGHRERHYEGQESTARYNAQSYHRRNGNSSANYANNAYGNYANPANPARRVQHRPPPPPPPSNLFYPPRNKTN